MLTKTVDIACRIYLHICSFFNFSRVLVSIKQDDSLSPLLFSLYGRNRQKRYSEIVEVKTAAQALLYGDDRMLIKTQGINFKKTNRGIGKKRFGTKN